MIRNKVKLLTGLAFLWILAGPVMAEEKQDGEDKNDKKEVSIKGKVMLDGKPQKPQTVNPGVDPFCQKVSEQRAIIDYQRSFMVTRKGELANVFVYVTKESLEKVVDLDSIKVPEDPVVLDQKGCEYIPHVFGVMAGQKLEIRNSDRTNHNVHGRPKKNQEFNFGQPKPGMKRLIDLANPETFVIKCDVHAWMSTWCHVMEHPFYATTDINGEFEITDLPPGEYDLVFWHETDSTTEKKSVKVEKEKATDIGEIKLKVETERRRRR